MTRFIIIFRVPQTGEIAAVLDDYGAIREFEGLHAAVEFVQHQPMLCADSFKMQFVSLNEDMRK